MGRGVYGEGERSATHRKLERDLELAGFSTGDNDFGTSFTGERAEVNMGMHTITALAFGLTMIVRVGPAYSQTRGPVADTLSTFMADTNLIGGDIDSIGIPGSSGGEAICAAECYQRKGCIAWTYVKIHYPTAELGARCWLKSSVPPATPNACCVSGVIKATKPY